MERMLIYLSFLLVAIYSACACEGRKTDHQWLLLCSEHDESAFMLGESELALKTEWGEIRVLLRHPALRQHNVGLGFIRMQPKALLLPHYIDASFVFLVLEGSARIGYVVRGVLMQQDLEAGDIYAVPAGTLFYLVSTDESRELKISGVYDMSDALETGAVKSFYVAGESNLFSGFDSPLLGAVFKVSPEGVAKFFSAQSKGLIVPTSLETYMKLSGKLETWSWKSIADFVLSKDPRASKPLSLFGKKSFFENRNGWFASTYGSKVPVLKKSRFGVTAVNLTTVSCTSTLRVMNDMLIFPQEALLAPHWNPQAALVGVVTNGSGTIQIAYPNGTNALNARLQVGSKFIVPRYFPVCIVSSEDSTLEYVGFTVSDMYHKHGHRPQFLTGTNSVLNIIDKDTLALSFNLPEELLRSVIEAQRDKIILRGDDLQM